MNDDDRFVFGVIFVVLAAIAIISSVRINQLDSRLDRLEEPTPVTIEDHPATPYQP